jgi:hypothetical protein
MILSNELDLLLSDPDRNTQLEITYQNGGKVNGSIRKVKYKPLRVVIQKSEPTKGERPRHKVVFDHVTHLLVVFKDGTRQRFE